VKRVGYLYERICDPDNIRTAILKASLGKRHHSKVARVLADIDGHVEQVRRLLLDETFEPSQPRAKVIHDGPSGKTRTIHTPAFFPDQVVHWALMLQLEPVIMRGMYAYNCGSIPGRGTRCGQKALRRWLDRYPRRTKYCLKMDVKQFYPSIDGERLKAMFRRKLKDRRTLALIDAIVDSTKGQPIGYYTSQWFANFYLEDLDHFIKQKLGARHYIRYIDDLVILGPNKRKLHRARREIESFLGAKGLHLKRDWQVFPVNARGIDFLGMRFFRDRTILRKRTALRIRRRAARIAKKGRLSVSDAAAIISYWGWIKHTNSHTFYHRYVSPFVTISAARRVVSLDGKLRQDRRREASAEYCREPVLAGSA
jgi:RNA-directed DNA polymerase